MVAQVTGCYADIYTWENLFLAYRKAARGKRSHRSVALFEFKLEDNLIQLHDELQAESYRPGQYTHFTIHEPKRRLISAAPFRDRVAHHALCQVIQPAFERSFIDYSYANRVGKGTHRALDACQHWLRQYRYVLPCDIKQFFPAIDHRILQCTLNRHIQDGAIRRLIALILASGVGVLAEEYEMVYFPGDDLFAVNRPRGLPIGNLTSQFWANCYLNPFDHFVTRELGCGAYLRYVDDFLLFADDQARLWQWRAAIIEHLASLRLTLHEDQALVRPSTEGVRFLGFIIHPTHRRLVPRKGMHFRRKLVKLLAQYQRGALERAQVDGVIAQLDQPCSLWRHLGATAGAASAGSTMNNASGEMPIFTKTVEFVTWLVTLTNHFPRLHRHTVTRRLLGAALDFQELILEANALRSQLRLDRLAAADVELSKVRLYLRLAQRMQWISLGQYEHGSRVVTELGRLLGGWQRVTN